MSTLLKDLYSEEFYKKFCHVLKQVVPKFEERLFQNQIFCKDWKALELKDRMRHTALVLNKFLDSNFSKALAQITSAVDLIEKNMFTTSGLEFMFFPDYIEQFGMNYPEESLRAMERITQFTSCEFAIRPFIAKNPGTLKQLLHWSTHKNEHVRRLASEGCRPRLPWAMALPKFKKDPTPILPILENLKNDPSEYVRRSVANNLNDIAKDNPTVVLKLANKWAGTSEETNKLVKHGLRTLLKQGVPEALEIIGYGSPEALRISNFKLKKGKINVGEYLNFEFEIENITQHDVLTRIEYSIYYLLKNGHHTRKVFKISEPRLSGNSNAKITRKQSFKPITTRKFYPGQHKIGIIVNGIEKSILDFQLSN